MFRAGVFFALRSKKMGHSSREWEKKVMEQKYVFEVNRVYNVPVSCKWHAPGAGLGMAGPRVLAGVGSQGAGPVLRHGGWRVPGGHRWKIGFISKDIFSLLKSPLMSSKSSSVALKLFKTISQVV